MRNFKRYIYSLALCISILLMPVTLILAGDVFTYGEMVYKSYKFSDGLNVVDRMVEVIEKNQSLDAYIIEPMRNKDEVLTSKKQFRKLNREEYNKRVKCYLFDYDHDNIYEMCYYSIEDNLSTYEIRLNSVSSINKSYLCFQNKNSIPIKIFVRPRLCGLLSSYDSSRKNSELFEECLIKKIGLQYNKAYEISLSAKGGSITQRLLSYDFGSKQWYYSRMIILFIFGLNIMMLPLFIYLRFRKE